MSVPVPDIVIEEVSSSRRSLINEQIETRLLSTLRHALPQAENRQFALTANLQVTDPSLDSLVGGVTAGSSYGWLLIKVLWVDSHYQRAGIGSRLLDAVEALGVDAGCHAAWLDTSNPDAMRFYLKQGFTTFGALENGPGQQPEGHQRWFMKKSLPAGFSTPVESAKMI